MKCSNLLLYCRRWYANQGNGKVSNMWRDFIHCIQCDGYMCRTKEDAVRHCLARMDEFAREFPEDAWQVSFPSIYRIIEKHKMFDRISASMGYDEVIDDMDHILWAFYDLYQFIDMKFFDGKFRPSDSVLPISKFDEETIQERDERLERQFEGCPKYEDTDGGKYIPTYDEIEHYIEEGWSWQG